MFLYVSDSMIIGTSHYCFPWKQFLLMPPLILLSPQTNSLLLLSFQCYTLIIFTKAYFFKLPAAFIIIHISASCPITFERNEITEVYIAFTLQILICL